MDMENEFGSGGGIESQASQDGDALVVMEEQHEGATATMSQASQASQASPSEAEAQPQPVTGSEQENANKKEIAARSQVWQHFIKIKDAAGIVRHAKCKYCHRSMKADPKSNGTSALNRHLNTCKRNPHKLNKDPTQGTLQATQGEGIGTWKFDQEVLRVAFAEMVIEDECPFCVGEKPGLRKFMAKACPRFQLPSRRTCTRDVVRCFFQEKAKLKKFLKDSCQRVCLTTDCWTSQQLVGYMTVTASWIDESWTLHKKVIGFFMTKGHKGEDIGKNMMRCLAEWGLESVMTITVDNASSNDTAVAYLRKQLMRTNIASGRYMHMRCAAHIVNLIVQDGLKEVDLSVKRVRGAVRWIRGGGSSSRMVKFKEIVEEEKIIRKPYMKLDVPTRWNSTYTMLKGAIAYEKVFTRLGEEDMSYVSDLSILKDGYGHPDEDDWENAKKMAEFLEHFHDLTERVSTTLHITSHSFFHEIGEVHLLIKSWLNSSDPLQLSMGMRMKEKFDKYWGVWHIPIPGNDNRNQNDKEKGKGNGKEKENINLLIFIAGCLDPRYKLSMYTKITIEEIFGEDKGQLVWEAVNSCVHELFEKYRTLYSANEDTTETSDITTTRGPRGGKLREVIAKKMKVSHGSSVNTKSEIDKYLAEETEDIEMKIDLLVWWKASEQRFPVLSRLARDVLAIPISTVASESAFSTSGRILDDFRSSLTPFMLEALVCTQDWLRRAIPLDIKENMEELVELEKELIEEYGEKGMNQATSASVPLEGSNFTKSISESGTSTT